MKTKLSLTVVLLLLMGQAAHAQFTYTTNNGAITITGYSGTDLAVTIPSTIDGLPVTGIGAWAFNLRPQITSVTLPSSIISIGNYAFWGCYALANVPIPSSVVNIGDGAFGTCSFTSLIIPNSVTNIGHNAFAHCSGLTNVSIPGSVTTIGTAPFEDCLSLYAIVVEPENANYSGVNGVLFDMSQARLIQYPIGNQIRHYTIPETVTTIGEAAFSPCLNLTSVTINGRVTNIGTYAFFFCTNLSGITLPSSLTSIESQAFAYCWALTNITIPGNVTNIGEYAFDDCRNLSGFIVAATNLFYSSVDGVLFNKSVTTLIQYPCPKSGSYVIPDGVTNIGSWAFDDCSLVPTISIPSSLTTIPDFSFSLCSGLTYLKIPGTVTHIGDYAFWYTGLTNISIPNCVTTMGEGALQSCTDLLSVSLPESMTNIPDVLLAGCSALTNISIPKNVVSIGNFALGGCSSLESLTIPSSVTSIDLGAFRECWRLTNVFFLGNAPVTYRAHLPEDTVFAYDTNTVVYYLPGTTGWSTFFGGLYDGGLYDGGVPTSLWTLPYPLVLSDSVGMQTKGYGFTVSWATNLSVVVEASTDLGNPVWMPLQTNALDNGVVNFTDLQWTNYPSRFYRVRSQ